MDLVFNSTNIKQQFKLRIKNDVICSLFITAFSLKILGGIWNEDRHKKEFSNIIMN